MMPLESLIDFRHCRSGKAPNLPPIGLRPGTEDPLGKERLGTGSWRLARALVRVIGSPAWRAAKGSVAEDVVICIFFAISISHM